jgi:hypothetical protein
MPGMDMGGGKSKKSPHDGHKQAAHDMPAGGTMQGMSHAGAMPAGQTHSGHEDMRGYLGPYPMAREASGTSWQPDTTPHAGVHATYGEWQTMYHALFNFTYDHQGGPRGGDKTFDSGMFMGMAQRISWNPIRELSLQVSYGHLHSPEQLEPDRNEDRFTMSAIYTQPFGKDNVWSTTAAWGRKIVKPGNTLDGFILETAAIFKKTYTVFARAERVQEDELVHDAPIYTVNKVSIGGIYDFYRTDHAKFGIGGLVSFYGLPGDLKPLYGDPTSAMAFLRLKIE